MDEWVKRDLECNWHPYTQMKHLGTLFPLILIERAEGIKLYDSEGNLYYDTISSWWCNVHGHNHPKIKQAIKEQLDSLEHVLFAGFTHRPSILFAEALLEVVPKNLKKIFFSDNGSTSVETALKISFQYWQNIGEKERLYFVGLENSYHGDTFGAMSVAGPNYFNEAFKPLFFSSFRVPSPNCCHCPMQRKKEDCNLECIEPLERLLKERNREIAAVILEPLLQAAGGMILYPVEYLRRVRELTKSYNVHLIVDEVATGFGRTGKMFAVEHADIEPDLMCLSKGITGGFLPLGATLTTDKIYNAFYDDSPKKGFLHGHTYTANPLACAAGLASLKIFEEEGVFERLSKIIPIFHKEMEERFRGLPMVLDVRYIGMIAAIELDPSVVCEDIGLRIYKEGLKEGLILRPLKNITYLFLPLCIKPEELDEIIERTYKVMCRILSTYIQ